MAKQLVPRKQKRPCPITLLTILTFVFSIVHWMKFVLAIQRWETLTEASLLVTPRYLALTGLGWGLTSLLLGWGLWTGRIWAWHGTQIAGALYYLGTWLDLLWATSPEVAQTRWPFLLGISILGLSYLFVTLYCPSSRRFFKRKPDVMIK